MRAFLPIVALLTLAACDNAEQDPETAVEHHSHDDAEKPAKGGAAPEVIPEVADDAQGTGQTGEDVAAQTKAALIPASYHGVWDYEDGTCARESDLRMEITGSQIVFYEAVGTVQSVAPDGPATVVALEMEGEGEVWESDFVLLFDEDGQTLTPFFRLDEQRNGDIMARKRCPV